MLQFVPEELIDKEVAMAAVTQKRMLPFVPEELIGKEVAMAAATQNLASLSMTMPMSWRSTHS